MSLALGSGELCEDQLVACASGPDPTKCKGISRQDFREQYFTSPSSYIGSKDAGFAPLPQLLID